MQGLDLGRAGFGFALNSLDAVKGLSDFAGKVSSTTSKVVPQVGGIAKGFDGMSNSLGGTFRGLDRFSRGLRGVSPEMAAHRENIYRLQDSMGRLSREMDIGKARFAERTASLQAAQRAGESLGTQLNDQRRQMAYANDDLGQAKLKLFELTNSTKLHAEAVAVQELKVKGADVELEVYQRRMAETRERITALIEREKVFDTELDVQAGKITVVQQRLSTINTEYQQHNDAIARLIARQKNEQATMDAAAATIARLGASYQNFYDQAGVESTKLQQMLERNIGAELLAEEAKFRKLKALGRQQQVEANQAAQVVANLGKKGKTDKDIEFRDAQIQAQKLMAISHTTFAQLDTQKAKLAALRIEEQNYQTTLDAKASLITTLVAKGKEEEAQVVKLTGDLEIQRKTYAGLGTSIQSHRDAIEKLRVTETNLRTQEVAEIDALAKLQRAQQSSVTTRQRLEAEVE